jgi:hypothetical protein
VRALVGLVVVAGSIAVVPATAAEPGNYVSLGDSYTAGPVIPLYAQPWGCLKSTNNYPNHLAPKIGLTLRDPSCSGAETEDMTQTQGVTPGPNPPQFDSLDANTQVVTLQIGGNDIGFSGIAEDCFSPSPLAGSPCRDTYNDQGFDEVKHRIDETAAKVDAVIDGIKVRAPNARIFLVNYSAIFPHTGGGELCWPQLPVSWGDIPWLREIQEYLNQMLADQAAANGAGLVDIYAASVGHDACQPPGLRWIEPLVPAGPAAPVHPNLIGMLAMADVAAQVING